jgi:uncharacterized protein YggE
MKRNSNKILLLIFMLTGIFTGLTAQERNFIDQPYLETNIRVDTMVVPDRIYLNILISEEDTKGRVSVEQLENRMASRLKSLGIDLEKQLVLTDLTSNFREYLLRKTDVQKTKSYVLLVYSGLSAGQAIKELEGIGISNISLGKTEFSGIEALKIALRKQAVRKAKAQAEAMLEPLGQSLGKALYISDLNTDYVGFQGKAAGVAVRGYAMEAADEPLDLDFEKLSVEANLNIKFAIN